MSPDGQGIELLFRSSNPAREILVFWGTAPMRGAEDLLRSTSKMQLDAGQTRCLVPVLAGVDFYFALLDAEAYKLGRAVLVPGENSTERPFRVPLGQAVADFAPAPALRPFPLPTLDAGVGVQSGLALQAPSAPAVPAPRNVSGETVRAIGDLRSSLGPQQPVRMVPQLLPVEEAAAVTEEGKGLKLIVQGPFTAGDMPEAERQIRNFLSLARTPGHRGPGALLPRAGPTATRTGRGRRTWSSWWREASCPPRPPAGRQPASRRARTVPVTPRFSR